MFRNSTATISIDTLCSSLIEILKILEHALKRISTIQNLTASLTFSKKKNEEWVDKILSKKF